MEDKNRSKEILHFNFVLSFVELILYGVWINTVDPQILKFIYSINIFSKFPDNWIKIVYNIVFILIMAKVMECFNKYVINKHFSKKYNA